MRPFTLLDTFTAPDGRKLTLHQRDERFFILLDGEELISTRAPGSERALAELGCQQLPNRIAPRILIGGLGFGYTLRAALAVLPLRAKVEVAEIFPSVVAWNRERLPRSFGETLRDPRVKIRQEDVRSVVATIAAKSAKVSATSNDGAGRYDAILLDVDDGPDRDLLKLAGSLYHEEGLRQLVAALVPGGRLAIWSASPWPTFIKWLKRAGFEHARSIEARGRADRGDHHTVFLGERSLKV